MIINYKSQLLKYTAIGVHRKMFFSGFFSGNITIENSVNSYNLLYETFQGFRTFETLGKSEMYNVQITKLPDNEATVYQYKLGNSYENSSLMCYYQIDDKIFNENNVKCFDVVNWLHTFLENKFYQFIRTNEN